MTKTQNLKLHIYRCSCGSYKRGSEFKKHISQNREHSLEWKRLVCTCCWKHESFGNDEFLKIHASCSIQTKTTNSQLCSWLGSIAKESKVDLDEDEEMADILFSDGDDFEEETKALPADTARTSFIERVEEKKKKAPLDELNDAIRTITEDPLFQPASPTPTPTPTPAMITTAPSSELPPPPPIPSDAAPTPSAPTTSSSTPSAPTTSSTLSAPTRPKGIQKQSRKWTADCRTAAISKGKAAENLMDRHTALQARYSALLKDYEEETRTSRKAKELQEDNIALQNKLATTGKLLSEADRKVSNLKCHLEYTSTEVTILHKQIAELTRKADLAKKAEHTPGMTCNRADLHIPIQSNVVCDRILAYTEDADEVECYNDPDAGINCLHVKVIMAGGEVSVSNQRVRKRAARPLQEPAAQTPRHY